MHFRWAPTSFIYHKPKEIPLAHPVLQVCWWWNLLAIIINFYTVKCLHFSIILYRYSCRKYNSWFKGFCFCFLFLFFFSSNLNMLLHYLHNFNKLTTCFWTVVYLIESIILLSVLWKCFLWCLVLDYALPRHVFVCFFSFLSCQLFCELLKSVNLCFSPNWQIFCHYSCKHDFFSATLSFLGPKEFSCPRVRLFAITLGTLVLCKNFPCVLHL